jgi:hypothetical protein
MERKIFDHLSEVWLNQLLVAFVFLTRFPFIRLTKLLFWILNWNLNLASLSAWCRQICYVVGVSSAGLKV